MWLPVWNRRHLMKFKRPDWNLNKECTSRYLTWREVQIWKTKVVKMSRICFKPMKVYFEGLFVDHFEICCNQSVVLKYSGGCHISLAYSAGLMVLVCSCARLCGRCDCECFLEPRRHAGRALWTTLPMVSSPSQTTACFQELTLLKRYLIIHKGIPLYS